MTQMKNIFIAVSLFIVEALSAQTMNVIGDSYVKNHRRPFEEAWHYKYAQAKGFTYNNYGRNGNCVAFDRTNDNGKNWGEPMWRRYTVMDTKADLVVIIAGHNDADKIGQNKDSLRMFADSLDVMLKNIKVHCPDARIAYVTPWFVPRAGFPQVCKAIRKVCKRNKVPVLWNHDKKSVIDVRNADFRKRYFQGPNDTAHLNENGHTLFYTFGEAFLDKVMASEGKYFEMTSIPKL